MVVYGWFNATRRLRGSRCLCGNPQITFWKLYHRRSTFAIESIEQVFNGTPGFGEGILHFPATAIS